MTDQEQEQEKDKPQDIVCSGGIKLELGPSSGSTEGSEE